MVARLLSGLLQRRTVFWIVSLGSAAVVAAPQWDKTWAYLCFAVAYIAIVSSVLVAIGATLSCDAFARKRRDICRQARHSRKAPWIAETKIKLLECSAVIAFIFLGIIATYFVLSRQEKYDLDQLEGILEPAHDPMPAHSCGPLRDDQIAIFAGSNVSVPAAFPHTVLQIIGEDRLVVDRNLDGSILISLDVFDERGILVVRIDKGQFKINRYHMWETLRKDRSTLEILDFRGRQVLKMRYLNRQAIQIDAVLRYPKLSSPIILDGNKLLYTADDTEISGNCLMGIDVSIGID